MIYGFGSPQDDSCPLEQMILTLERFGIIRVVYYTKTHDGKI